MESKKEAVGQTSITGLIRQDVVSKRARSSQTACNRLCIAKDIRDIQAAFGECQNATTQWILGLADPDLNAAEMKVTLIMLDELLGRLLMRGRQLEQWFVDLTGYGSKGRVVSAATQRLINYMRDILEEWDSFKSNVAKDIAERQMVQVIGLNTSEVVQAPNRSEPNKLQGVNEIGIGKKVDCDAGVTNTSVTEYEAGNTIVSCCDTDSEGTDDETVLDVTEVIACRGVDGKVFPHIFSIQHYDPLVNHGVISHTRVAGFGALQKVGGTQFSSTEVERGDIDKVTTVSIECLDSAAETSDESDYEDMYSTNKYLDMDSSDTDGECPADDELHYQHRNTSQWEKDMAKKHGRKYSTEMLNNYHKHTVRIPTLVSQGEAQRRQKKFRTSLDSIIEYSAVMCKMSCTCILSVVLPATVKAGCRSGAHRHRIPLVVDKSIVFFSNLDVYAVDEVKERLVHVVLCSQGKCIFFLPIARTSQDFAAHAG